MLNRDPLSWPAQIAAHAAFVAGQRSATAAAAKVDARRGPKRGSEDKRELLLAVVADGKRHRFAEFRAVLPAVSAKGVAYLVRTLIEAGRLDFADLNATNRVYFLPEEPRDA